MSVTRVLVSPEGPKFSRLIMGYWRLLEWQMSPQDLLRFIEQHLELGITTIDHADIYGSYGCEAAFGQALKLKPGLREQLQIVTKCGIALPSAAHPGHQLPHYNSEKAHIIASAEQSLRHFGTDHLDLLLIHRPDYLMNADEMAKAFNNLKKSGKVRHFGVSNFTPSQFELLQSRLDYPLVTNQVEISPLYQDTLTDGTLDQCQRRHSKPMAWSCLGGGRLFKDPAFQALRDELAQIALEVDAATIEQVVFAWVMMLPSQPLPIIGSGRIERVSQAVQAEHIQLSRQQWYRIRRAALGRDVD
ncbi:oxidoreductase [Zobellella denitrificans]|uniref:Oxidoreductase n=1 Tax=Zobellella denitrificans TaxID=347534 RepID=A0A291HK41_9GAMM|nr:aldo/keto reductase family oxidoreductase [Zobellella denitrificans]ATG72441.1 oxidoreductase [Zobellella denitrificans]